MDSKFSAAMDGLRAAAAPREMPGDCALASILRRMALSMHDFVNCLEAKGVKTLPDEFIFLMKLRARAVQGAFTGSRFGEEFGESLSSVICTLDAALAQRFLPLNDARMFVALLHVWADAFNELEEERRPRTQRELEGLARRAPRTWRWPWLSRR